jgi:concentrative nucleoside transporter, CNT family
MSRSKPLYSVSLSKVLAWGLLLFCVLLASPMGFAQEIKEGALEASTQVATPGFLERVMSFFGIFILIGVAWVMSTHRKRVDWRLVGIGVALQLFFATFILITPIGRPIFDAASAVFNKIISFTNAGSGLLFGGRPPLDGGMLTTLAFGVLPTIIFFSSLMAMLYHLGVMQRVVSGMSWLMRRTMKTSGSETLSATANIFVGQTEAPLMIQPYISTMTMSELMAVMVGGFATVAGGVMAIYVAFLEPYFPGIAGHLMAASVMSAPAALVIAKVMYPETEESKTKGEIKVEIKQSDANLIDAAARGAGEGLSLTLNVAAMLLAFVALIAMVNYIFAIPSYWQHYSSLSELWFQLTQAKVDLKSMGVCDPTSVTWEQSSACVEKLTALAMNAQIEVPTLWSVVTLESLFGYLFAPFAVVIGIPMSEAIPVGQLLGTKIVLNEFIAYQQLSELVKSGALSERSVLITNYALCGFANFGSIAIQIGGIGGIAPERRGDLAKLGVRAMIGGTLAAMMTATVAGVLL